MSEYAILLTALLTSVTVVGGLILGAIYFFYNSIKAGMAEMKSDIKAVDAKTDRIRVELDSKIDSSTDTLRSEMNAGFASLDAKIDSKTDDLHAKIDSKTDDLHAKIDRETDNLRSEMNAGFARLDDKIDSKTDNLEDKVEREISSLRSDLGGRIDANTEKLAELATEVQVHLRTHHLMSEIERITTPPDSRAEEERELEEEANQPS